MHLFTVGRAQHTITYRLKDLEPRLDSARFVRLGRGTLANLDAVAKVNVMPGATHLAVLTNGQKLQISRIQSLSMKVSLAVIFQVKTPSANKSTTPNQTRNLPHLSQ